ncbi:MAG: ClpP family protease, partial [Bacteriovoracia bacterium]
QPLISGTLRGQASDIEIHARDIVDLKKRTHALYAERTGTAIEVFEELMQRDRWVDPIEAVKLGLISKIIQTRDELEQMIQAKR